LRSGFELKVGLFGLKERW